jgi:SOS-response transcriptional repressor LexA
VVALDDEGQNTLKRYEGYDSKKKMHILGYMNEASYPDRKIEVKELTVQGVAGHVIKKL